MVAFSLNGRDVDIDVPEDAPLLVVLSNDLHMNGVKFGCGKGQCGSCTVLIDGEPVRSCQTAIEDVEGASVTTIEGLGDAAAKAVQTAWAELNVPQCGYCQSGQIMSATALLADNNKPTDADIDEAMQGNLCRCSTYVRIRGAIHRASELMEA